ncbi:MAG TPA: hypothetical protein VEH62_14835 [Gemmatimonadales bacterium]|nr:hypothetical protein [Gemmatimonadales bacterium]
MAAACVPRLAGASAPGIRLGAAVRVAAMTVSLACSPLLARTALAQEGAFVRASIFVTHSVIGARLLPDSTAVAAAASPLSVLRLRLADLGTLDVQSREREEICVSPKLESPEGRPTMVVLIAYVGS